MPGNWQAAPNGGLSEIRAGDKTGAHSNAKGKGRRKGSSTEQGANGTETKLKITAPESTAAVVQACDDSAAGQ